MNFVKGCWNGGALRIQMDPGHSPAQKLYGHPLQSFVLAHHRSFAPEWQTKADTVDRREQDRLRSQTEYFNRSKRPLERLKIGVMMDVQDPRTKRRSQRGTIVAVSKHRDYYVKLPSGRVYWRNRVFLRPYLPPQPAGVDSQRLHQRQDQVFPTECRDQIHASVDTEENNCRTKEDTVPRLESFIVQAKAKDKDHARTPGNK